MFTLIELKLLDLELMPRQFGVRMLDDRLLADIGMTRADLRQPRKPKR